MASTSYLTRAIISEYKGNDLSDVDYSGADYKLLGNAKNMPSPMGTPNTVESTGLEDASQTFEEGIKQTEQKSFTVNLEKKYLDGIKALNGKRVKVIQLYGTDGLGSVGKFAYVAQLTYTVAEVSGTDQILELTITATPNNVTEDLTDELTVTESAGTFTVAEA